MSEVDRKCSIQETLRLLSVSSIQSNGWPFPIKEVHRLLKIFSLRCSLNFKPQSWNEILYICQSQHTYPILYHAIYIYVFQPQGPSSGTTTTTTQKKKLFANTLKKTRMRPHSFTKDFSSIFLWFFSNILTWSICDCHEVMYNYIRFILNTCRLLLLLLLLLLLHYNPTPHYSKLYNLSQVGSNFSVLASFNPVFLRLSICSLVVLSFLFI